MKNTNLFLAALGSVILTSCGSSYVASQSSGGFTNGIYYTESGSGNVERVRSSNELSDLQSRTKKSIYNSGNNTQTIFIGDTNVVDLTVRSDYNYTYRIVDDDESYEARLRKFDSPVYNINIQIDNGWDDWFLAYDRYAWRYNPWYSPSWGWYWRSSWWAAHTWYSPAWYWNDFWFDAWYGYPYPYYGYHRHWWPGYAPVPPHHNHWWDTPHFTGRPRYYGRRPDSPSYRNVNGRHNGSPSGSMVRREPTMHHVRGNNNRPAMNSANNISQSNRNNQNVNSGGSSYRRVGSNATASGTSNRNTQDGVRYNSNAVNSGSNRDYSSSSSSSGSTYRRGATQQQHQQTKQSSGNSLYRKSGNSSSSGKAGNSGSSYNRSNNNNNNSYNRQSSYRTNNSNTTTSGNYNRSRYSSESSGSSYNNSSYNSGSSYRSGSSGTSGGGSSYRRR